MSLLVTHLKQLRHFAQAFPDSRQHQMETLILQLFLGPYRLEPGFEIGTAEVSCPEGTHVTGGGYELGGVTGVELIH